MRYVKRMIKRREFDCGMYCYEDRERKPEEGLISVERVVEARTQYYQSKMVDAMLKILYTER